VLSKWFENRLKDREKLGWYQDVEIKVSDLKHKVENLASDWNRLGITHGDVVAVQGDKLFLLQAWYACTLLKAVFCPIPMTLNTPHLQSQQNKKADPLKSRRILWQPQNGACSLLSENYEVWRMLDRMQEPALLLRTSTSNQLNELGLGRWVAYESQHTLRQIHLHSAYLKSHSCAKRIQILPLYHTFGLVLDLAVGIDLKQQITFFDPEQIRSGSWLKNRFFYSTAEPWDVALTPRLAYIAYLKLKSSTPRGLIHLGGARSSSLLKEQLKECFSHVIEGYGLTECGPGVLMQGQPLGCEVRLKDIGSDLGILQIKSPTMGIWQDPSVLDKQQDIVLSDASSALSDWDEDWFNSYDLAIYSKNSFEVLGRLGRYLKSYDGCWIFLDFLEYQLENHFQILAIKLYVCSSGYLKVRTLQSDIHLHPLIEKKLNKLFQLPCLFNEPEATSHFMQSIKSVI
jgi:hypothetical protein